MCSVFTIHAYTHKNTNRIHLIVCKQKFRLPIDLFDYYCSQLMRMRMRMFRFYSLYIIIRVE